MYSPRVSPDAYDTATSLLSEQPRPRHEASLVDTPQVFARSLDTEPLLGSLYQPFSQQLKTSSQQQATSLSTKATPLPPPSYQPTLYVRYHPAEQVESDNDPQSQARQQVSCIPANSSNASEKGTKNTATEDYGDFEYFDLDLLDRGYADLQGVNMSTEDIDAILNTPMDVLLSSQSGGYSGNISSVNAPRADAQQVHSTRSTSPILSLVSADTDHQNRDGTVHNRATSITSGGEDPGDDAVDESSEEAGTALWEPSKAVDFITLEFDTEQKYLEYLRSRKERRPVDATLPRTWVEKAHHVLRLKKAMVDISQAEDSGSASFIKRWLHALTKLYYEDVAIEALCWEIVNKAVDLHLHGPGVLNCHDPGHSKKHRSGMQLTFQERMDRMVEYVLKSKARVDTLMKHDTLDTFIAIPHKLIPTSKANREFNGERGMDIKAGKASRKANKTVTPASFEDDTATPIDSIDTSSGLDILQPSSTNNQHPVISTHRLSFVARTSATDGKELTNSPSTTSADPLTARKRPFQQSLPAAKHQTTIAVSLTDPEKPYSLSISPQWSTPRPRLHGSQHGVQMSAANDLQTKVLSRPPRRVERYPGSLSNAPGLELDQCCGLALQSLLEDDTRGDSLPIASRLSNDGFSHLAGSKHKRAESSLVDNPLAMERARTGDVQLLPFRTPQH